MNAICPTITAYSTEEYKTQLDRISSFAKRIHIDFMDGDFSPTVSPGIHEAWWPKALQADLHIMHRNPLLVADDIVGHKPHLVVVHAEANDISSFVHTMHEARLPVGIALLQDTPVETLNHFINVIDHVLIFSGNLGHHGGSADLGLLGKVHAIRQMNPQIEIGWDGGINDQNILVLRDAGVSVFNTGGYIQNADDPKNAYESLTNLLQS